jgi:outer membrane protein TolC
MTQSIRRLTLEEAQARASGTATRDLGQLGVDAARYHREAVQADYFPKIDATFANLHFNKFLGDTIRLGRRVADLPLLEKDQTIVAFTVTQPVTPIFKVREAVQIARADETIARAKAALASANNASVVEQTYFALMIAQRQQTFAAAQFETNGSRLENARTH